MNAHMSTYMRTLSGTRPLSVTIIRFILGENTDNNPMIGIMCINILTNIWACGNCLIMITDAKKKALLSSGTLNPNPESVQFDLFKMDFFDPCDRAQVKYEMLRAHSVDGDSVTEVCRQFGFSRESFYKIEQAFRELGFSSFLPGKRGRKGPVKLKGEILQFVVEKNRENPDIDPGQLAALIRERYGMEIHRTTVMRGIKKKLRSPEERPTRGIRGKG